MCACQQFALVSLGNNKDKKQKIEFEMAIHNFSFFSNQTYGCPTILILNSPVFFNTELCTVQWRYEYCNPCRKLLVE